MLWVGRGGGDKKSQKISERRNYSKRLMRAGAEGHPGSTGLRPDVSSL